MNNNIIIGIVALVVIIAAAALVRRSGRKGCCGSAGDYTPRKKKLKNVIATKVFTVEGMHCEKCSGRVMEAINDIPGVAALVDLKKGIALVSYEQEVPDDLITARIQRHGYTVTQIQ